MIKCSVCINTYKRPFLLKKLLESINNQILDENIQLEMIVVDNDPEKQAEPIVNQSRNFIRFPIRYYTQPVKNISLTRNVAVRYSTGEYLLFVDDDEYADTYWVKNLVRCIQYYNADAVFGKVIPYFEENAPKWVEKWGLFARPCNKTGEFPKYTYTSNCIVKSATIKSVEGPFNPEYGITGGEDTLLFGLLHRKGSKLVSCFEAVVYDYFPAERATMRWLLRRGFRTGNTYSRRRIQFSKNKLKTKFILAIKAIVSLIYYFLMMCVTIPTPKYFTYWLLFFSRKIGHIFALFNYYHEEYKTVSFTDFSELNKSGQKTPTTVKNN